MTLRRLSADPWHRASWCRLGGFDTRFDRIGRHRRRTARDRCPEAAGELEVTAGHDRTRVRLADGAGEFGVAATREHRIADLLDRLTHRCPVFEMNGESYRFREPMKAKKEKKAK
jgi:hypothetical protein